MTENEGSERKPKDNGSDVEDTDFVVIKCVQKFTNKSYIFFISPLWIFLKGKLK